MPLINRRYICCVMSADEILIMSMKSKPRAALKVKAEIYNMYVYVALRLTLLTLSTPSTPENETVALTACICEISVKQYYHAK